jgi:3-oxoacyl-[acyl-carrier protein] reductase
MRSVLITGGTGSVGRSLVKAFATTDFHVTFQFYSQLDAAAELERETGAKGVACDLSSEDACIALEPAHNCDILVNNAAINNYREEAADVSIEGWRKTLLINLTAPFLLCRSTLPRMISKKWGRIINISSIYGLRGTENNLPYTVSKHGLSGLTKTIAREYGSKGITCNEICPGPINSALLKRIGDYYHERGGVPTREFLQSLEDEIPVRRLALPDDIAACALFLADEEASYINGVSIPVDGGLIA